MDRVQQYDKVHKEAMEIFKKKNSADITSNSHYKKEGSNEKI